MTMSDYAKPLPAPDEDTKPFWDGCRERQLKVQQCRECGKRRWPPRGLCPSCHSWTFDWVALPGTGTVYSYVIVHHANPAFAPEAPYTVAEISIDGAEPFRITSNVIGCAPEKVHVGMPVEVFFEDVTDEVTLPKFRPA
jgi:uncharacterized OB-fold protein